MNGAGGALLSITNGTNGSATMAVGGRGQCVMNILPSQIPTVDIVTALATIKAEFLQNYIVAMINRKVKKFFILYRILN